MNSSDIGFIETPGYQINGSIELSYCVWYIEVSAGSRVNLTLNNVLNNSFNEEIWVLYIKPNYCFTSSVITYCCFKNRTDVFYLQVYEGENNYNENSLLIKATDVSSFLRPFFVVSKTNKIVLQIHSYNSLCSSTYSKLRFSYTATTKPIYGKPILKY